MEFMTFPRFLGLLLLAGCAAGSPAAGDGFCERLLGTIPDGELMNGLAAFSQDGTRVAYVERTDGAQRAVCGAWKSRPFSLVC